MSREESVQTADESHLPPALPAERTPLRDNLESIAIAIVLVLCVRQLVVEAFRIRHGSMAPTLVGDHRELRCPNCGYCFDVGSGKSDERGNAECPNCHWSWPGLSRFDDRHQPLSFRTPEWLWNTAYSSTGRTVGGTDAANRVFRGADRIFVDKVTYTLRAPRRWEVAVFLYPLYDAHCPVCDWTGQVDKLNGVICPVCGSPRLEITPRNYIKRIVGLPGETVELVGGDVYINGAIERKPPQIQNGLWFDFYDSRFPPTTEVERIWDLPGGQERWTRQAPGGARDLNALGAEAPVMGSFAPKVTDTYAYDGPSNPLGEYGLPVSGRHEVGDCRIAALVRVEEAGAGGGAVLLGIAGKGHEFVYTVGTGELQEGLLEDGAAPIRTSAGARLPVGESHWISLENYDDRIVAMLDGRPLMRYEYEGRGQGERAVRFGALGARVIWERITIQRDVYYGDAQRRMGEQGYQLKGDEYYVLGDNSPASSDSRLWDMPGVPAGNLIGRACFVFWPLHRMKWLPAGLAEAGRPRPAPRAPAPAGDADG